jgi:hypothetical protein
LTLIETINQTPIKELLRAIKSDKGYLYFYISVFSRDISILIRSMDSPEPILPHTWNGYDFIIENDNTSKGYIISSLKKRLKSITDKSQLMIVKKAIFINAS